MGAITGFLGLGGGSGGTSAPPAALAPIQQGVNQYQAGTAYGQTQQGLQSQQALLQALQGQGGLGLQNQAASGYANLAAGRGPNPALAQLAQQTGANVAQTGALMAGQRGAGQNVGLLARQAGQQGAAAQQQAVGQAATLQAQQQIAGLQGLAGQANTIAGQQIGQTNANTQAQQAQYANVLNALGQQNQAQIANQGSVNAANAGIAQAQVPQQGNLLGGLLQGGAVGAGLLAKGGEIAMADGGPSLGVDTNVMPQAAAETFPQFLSRVTGPSAQAQPTQQAQQQSQPALTQGASMATQAAIKGIGALLAGAKGGEARGRKDMRSGGHVAASNPKQKAVAKGDSYSNDKIPAVLSEHEIVLPRHVTLSKDPPSAAAAFVAATIAKRKGKKS